MRRNLFQSCYYCTLPTPFLLRPTMKKRPVLIWVVRCVQIPNHTLHIGILVVAEVQFSCLHMWHLENSKHKTQILGAFPNQTHVIDDIARSKSLLLLDDTLLVAYFWMKIYKEVNMATWPKMVKLRESNISNFLKFNINLNHCWKILKNLMICGIKD